MGSLKDVYCGLKSEFGRIEAAALIEHFYNLSFNDVVNSPDRSVDEAVVEKAAVRRREGYPLQYIIGEWEFYGYRFLVGEGVLIPRQDTETLVDCALEKIPENAVCLDICSGSGCIPIAVCGQRNDVTFYAVEKSPAAFKYLKMNNHLYGDKIHIINCDALVPDFKMPYFDVITANPPYLSEADMKSLQKEVSFEPEEALLAEDNGYYFYKRISEIYKNKLKNNGWLIFEIGIGMHEKVSEILKNNGFSDICQIRDMCGIIRVVCGKYKRGR